VPIFIGADGAAIPHADLDSETILPFLIYTEVPKRGGSSRVFETEIHPEHDRLDNVKVRYDIITSCTV